MHSKMKKLTTFVVALCAAMTAFTGCGSNSYSPKKLQGNISGAVKAGDNGGFVVEKGDFVYFINGQEDYTADNTLGEVKKGALMRISKADLTAKNYDKTETVVPSLFVAQDTTSGIYLYGDYVYFASPTTEKNKDGSVAKSNLSFHRAKLDGSSTEKEIKDYFFRLDDNTVVYRFVEVNDTVYCMYVQNSTLYSFNTKTGDTYTLVENASSQFFFDKNDLSNPNVYYTMAVTDNIGTDNEQTVSYNQVYSVCADATAEAGELSYTTSYGYTYTFDKQVKDGDGFDASDYATYPYVNLGEIVLDGKGSADTYAKTQYNHDESAPVTPNGYVYTLQNYVDGGAYLTRKDVNSSSSDGDGVALYYLADETKNADAWKSVAGNKDLSKVAVDTKKASSASIFQIDANGVHSYIYISGTTIRKATAKADGTGTVQEDVLLVPDAAENTVLLKTDGKWLYFYSAGTNGNNLWRVNYTGTADKYIGIPTTEEYKAQQILKIDWNSSWYKPEFVGNVLFYSNAQSFGTRAFNYISVVDLSGSGDDGFMTYDELKAFNEKYDDVQEYFTEVEKDYPNLAKAMRYYYRTGETKAFDEFIQEAKAQGYKDHYRYSEYELTTFAAFTAHEAESEFADKFKDGDKYYDEESYFYNYIGVMKAADEEEIADVWTSEEYIAPLPDLTEESEDNTAKVVWTVVGVTLGVLAVAAAVIVPIVISHKKKVKLMKDREATRVRNRDRLDVTDDKSIDVYETEETEEEESTEQE